MSAEARAREIIDEAIREAVKPLRQAVDELSARLAAVEGSSGPADAEPQKRAPRGRTARAKAQSADASATADDGASAQSGDYNSETAVNEASDASEKVPEQRRGASK